MGIESHLPGWWCGFQTLALHNRAEQNFFDTVCVVFKLLPARSRIVAHGADRAAAAAALAMFQVVEPG